MSTVFDSSKADEGVDGLVILDNGKRFKAGGWFVQNLSPLTSLSDARSILGIISAMPNVAFVTTPDATDATSGFNLVNANKAKINELIQVMINMGLMLHVPTSNT